MSRNPKHCNLTDFPSINETATNRRERAAWSPFSAFCSSSKIPLLIPALDGPRLVQRDLLDALRDDVPLVVGGKAQTDSNLPYVPREPNVAPTSSLHVHSANAPRETPPTTISDTTNLLQHLILISPKASVTTLLRVTICRTRASQN